MRAPHTTHHAHDEWTATATVFDGNVVLFFFVVIFVFFFLFDTHFIFGSTFFSFCSALF